MKREKKEQKSAEIGAPTLGAPTLGAPTLPRPHPLGPHPAGPHPSGPKPSGPHPPTHTQIFVFSGDFVWWSVSEQSRLVWASNVWFEVVVGECGGRSGRGVGPQRRKYFLKRTDKTCHCSFQFVVVACLSKLRSGQTSKPKFVLPGFVLAKVGYSPTHLLFRFMEFVNALQKHGGREASGLLSSGLLSSGLQASGFLWFWGSSGFWIFFLINPCCPQVILSSVFR